MKNKLQELKEIIKTYMKRVNMVEGEEVYDGGFRQRLESAKSYRDLVALFAKEDLEDDFDDLLNQYFSDSN